jgi:diacylglycerol kinase family enzyme
MAEILHGLRGHTERIVHTRYPGHAAELAIESRGHEGVVAVGGDGTLFEILQGMDRREQRLALVPAGRGNSLARDLGLLSGGLLNGGLLTAMHWEQSHRIDLMEATVTAASGAVSTHLSASTVGLGYPAQVTLMARRLARLGKMSYAVAGMATVPVRFDARVQLDEEPVRAVRLSGFVANNTRHVANFVAFRGGSYSDGVFDVMEMDAGVVKQCLHNVSALSATGVYEPYPRRQASRARLWLDAPQGLMLDGEMFPDSVALDVRILPAALECNGPKARP